VSSPTTSEPEPEHVTPAHEGPPSAPRPRRPRRVRQPSGLFHRRRLPCRSRGTTSTRRTSEAGLGAAGPVAALRLHGSVRGLERVCCQTCTSPSWSTTVHRSSTGNPSSSSRAASSRYERDRDPARTSTPLLPDRRESPTPTPRWCRREDRSTSCRSGVRELRSSFPPPEPEAVWVVEFWESAAAHQASLELDAVQRLIARARPVIASMGERFEFHPVGGKGLGPRPA
jgi:hypothetical protein